MKSKTYLIAVLTLGAAVATSWAVPPTKSHYPTFEQQKEQRQERIQNLRNERELKAEQGRSTTVALSVNDKKAKTHSHHFRHKVGMVNK